MENQTKWKHDLYQPDQQDDSFNSTRQRRFNTFSSNRNTTNNSFNNNGTSRRWVHDKFQPDQEEPSRMWLIFSIPPSSRAQSKDLHHWTYFSHESLFHSPSIENTIQIVNLNDFVTENSLSNLFSKGTHSLFLLTNLHSWIHHLCKSESEQFWQVQCIFLSHSLPISREPPPSPTEPTIMLPRLWSCSIRAKLMVAWLLSLFFVCFPPLSALCPLENPF